jgi:hypothetical protein
MVGVGNVVKIWSSRTTLKLYFVFKDLEDQTLNSQTKVKVWEHRCIKVNFNMKEMM